ncbi:MAG: hypothetical protein U0704_07390 [Candidatus Eisenbacteria bacterium]
MKSRLLSLLRLTCPIALMLLGAGLGAGLAVAQSLDSTAWVANGTVRALARDGSTLYVGGDFTNFAPPSGGLVAVQAANATPASAPTAAGAVYRVIADGSGGWYYCGTFERIGGVARRYFAHQLANGSWDSWAPEFNGPVYALALSGNTLYVGGAFTSVAGSARYRAAAFDLATHSVSAWDPAISSYNGGPTPFVRSIAVTPYTVCLAGSFSTVGATSVANLVEVSVPLGEVRVSHRTTGVVNEVVALGNTAYLAGGLFNDMDGEAHTNLCVFAPNSSGIGTWAPAPDGYISTISVADDGIYVCGGFTTIAGEARPHAAKFDLGTELQPWAPLFDADVTCLKAEGDRVYAAGLFTTSNGQASSGFVALDRTTGANVATSTLAPNGATLALGTGGADGLVRIGGTFTGLGGTNRSLLAAIDLNTGQPAASWCPQVYGTSVQALAVHGRKLYIAGKFQLVEGQLTRGFAMADLVTHEIVYTGSAGFDSVLAIAASDEAVYLGGRFATLNGSVRLRLAALDPATLALQPWNPTANSNVRGLTLAGPRLYVSGDFTSIGGVTQRGIARLARATGVVDALWRPAPNSTVYASTLSGPAVWFCGAFNIVNGATVGGVARVDTTTGATTVAIPAPNYSSYAIATGLEGVHLGGYFTTIGGQPRLGFATYDASGTALTAARFDVGAYSPMGYVYALDAGAGITALGGTFRSVAERPGGFFALLRSTYTITAQTVSPATLATPQGAPTNTCTGRVLVPGVTSGMGATPGLVGQFGFGPAADAPSAASWTWTSGTFSTDISGAEDWVASVTPATSGTFAYGWRFAFGGGEWVYGDLDGSANGWSAATAGVLTVTAPTVDFAVMTGPASMSVGTFHESSVVSASVWMTGVTEGWGGNSDLVAQLGVGPEGEDPGTSPLWTWTNASWTGKDGGNDVYGATIVPTEPGTSRYAYRFRYQNSVWKYADLDGTGNGFDWASMGTLTVFAQEPDANAQLLAPQQLVVTVGEGSRMALGHYTVMHVADPVPLMNAHFGWGPAGTRPDTSSAWTWEAVFFDPYQQRHGDWGGIVLPAPAVAGEYAYTFRFRYDSGTWSYADLDGSANGCDPALLGRLSVSAQPTIGWSQLDTQAPVTADAGVQTPVQGLAWSWPSAGLRANATFTADVGFGPHGTRPDVSPAWQWSPATLVEDLGDGLRHWEGLLRGTQAGEYDWCFRFRRDGGPYAYADLDGGDDGYELDAAGRFTVTGTLDAGEPLPDALAFGIAGANPARGGASLRLALPGAARVRVTIHDIAGRCVAQLAEGERGAGVHVFDWRPANGAGAAVWFAQASVNGRVLTRRFVTIE